MRKWLRAGVNFLTQVGIFAVGFAFDSHYFNSSNGFSLLTRSALIQPRGDLERRVAVMSLWGV